MKNRIKIFHGIALILSMVLFWGCEAKTESKPSSVPTATVTSAPTSSPTPFLDPTETQSPAASSTPTISPVSETDVKYELFCEVSNGISQKCLEERYLEDLCQEWYDTKQKQHIITEQAIDRKEFKLFHGLQYTDDFFGFCFNFTDQPMQYPLFVMVDTKKGWASIRTYFENETDRINETGGSYYTNMFWSRKKSSDFLMEYLTSHENYFRRCEFIDYYTELIRK